MKRPTIALSLRIIFGVAKPVIYNPLKPKKLNIIFYTGLTGIASNNIKAGESQLTTQTLGGRII